jgi:DNA-binding MarR family transcriptional regulator
MRLTLEHELVMSTPMLLILTIIVVAGILGGFVNFLLAKPDDLPTPSKTRSVVIGLAASALVPLFLNMISSNLVDLIKGGDNMKLLVMFGFCLVAAISSTAFIRTLSDRVLSEVKQAKREALEAKAEVSEVHQAIQPIVDKETESDPAELAATVQQTISDLTASQQKLLSALSSGEWTLRSESGLAKEIAVDRSEVATLLQELHNRGLVGRSHVSGGKRGTRFYITDAGRNALKHAPEGTTGA